MGMGRCELLDQSQVPGGETEERSLLLTRGVRGEQGRWEGDREPPEQDDLGEGSKRQGRVSF